MYCLIFTRHGDITSRLQRQVTLLDTIETIRHDNQLKLRELANQAEPVVAEAEFLVDHLEGRAYGSTSQCSKLPANSLTSVEEVPRIAARLEDLLEEAGQLREVTGVEKVRARLRAALAGLSRLVQVRGEQFYDAVGQIHAPSALIKWRKMIYSFFLFVILPLICFVWTQPSTVKAGLVNLSRLFGDCLFLFAPLGLGQPVCVFYPWVERNPGTAPPPT